MRWKRRSGCTRKRCPATFPRIVSAQQSVSSPYLFADGSPHYRDYVAAADATKRKRLKARGYRIVVVKAEDPEAGLHDLQTRLGR